MALESIIPPETLLAYLETDFIVFDQQILILKIDNYSEALRNLYKAHKIKTCIVISAYNPYGQVLKESVNIKRNTDLTTELDYKDLKYFPGEGKHPAGKLLSESSYLVLDLSLEESCTLGKKYEQNAIIWCDSDCVPQLVLLR